MNKIRLTTVPILLSLIAGQGLAWQAQPQAETQQPKPRPPVRLSFVESVKRSLQRLGATVDPTKGSADMVVSNYADPKGGKTTIVIVNDRRKSLLGFYVYNFGSLKNAANREEVYRYLLSANDAITIGSFFVDSDDDVGYKYLISNSPAFNQVVFEAAYLTMAAVARERRPEIRQLLGLSTGDEKPDVKKAAEEKPPGND